jgi:hypothetical protein
MKGRDVRKVWENEGLNVTTKPFWLSRRFVGLVTGLVVIAIAKYLDIEVESEMTQVVVDNLMVAIEAVVGLWAALLMIIGEFQKSAKLGLKIKKE